MTTKLRPIIRVGLGIAALVAVSTVWIAVGDQHWAAALVLAVLALACTYPALTGRDPLDRRHRRRRHRRHRSRRHAPPTTPSAADTPTSTPAGHANHGS